MISPSILPFLLVKLDRVFVVSTTTSHPSINHPLSNFSSQSLRNSTSLPLINILFAKLESCPYSSRLQPISQLPKPTLLQDGSNQHTLAHVRVSPSISPSSLSMSRSPFLLYSARSSSTDMPHAASHQREPQEGRPRLHPQPPDEPPV